MEKYECLLAYLMDFHIDNDAVSRRKKLFYCL